MRARHRAAVKGAWAAAFGAAAVALSLAASPAAAQFVCTTTPAEVACTNSGTATGIVNSATGVGQNATTTNTGSNIGDIVTETNFGGNATSINSGSNTGSIQSFAVGGGGGDATVINSGSSTGPLLSLAAGGFLADATVINSGTTSSIRAESLSGNATVVNSGTVTGVVNAFGYGGSATLTNSGTITNPGGPAISSFGSHVTLNVLPGSFIAGRIIVQSSHTVNISAVNQNLTLEASGPTTVNGTVPFAATGNQIATIDVTPFGVADRNLMDFTRGVSGILGSLGGTTATSNAPNSSAFAPSDPVGGLIDDAFAVAGLAYASDQAMVFKNPTSVAADGRAVWARGFGGRRTQEPEGSLFGATTTFWGGAMGFDLIARPDLRLGLFVGGGVSRMSLDGNMGFTNTKTGFGGMYGRYGFASFGAPSFLDFALHFGGSANAGGRPVNNNLAPGGIEIAAANYSSFYVSPELKYGVHLPLGSQFTLTPSVQVRHVVGFFDGYTETDTTAPLTVANRTIQDIEERGELKLTHTALFGPNVLRTNVHVGVLGLQRLGDTNVNTVLLGASLPFATPGKNTVTGATGGGGFEFRTREGISFFGAAEAIGFSDQSIVWSGRGGIRSAL